MGSDRTAEFLALTADGGAPGRQNGNVFVAARTAGSSLTVGGGARPQGWLLTYTLSGRRRYVAHGAEFDATPGTLTLMGEKAWLPGRGRRLPERWDAWYVRFRPWQGWSPPASFERLATEVYTARASLASTRVRIEDAFGRLETDLSTRRAALAMERVAAHGTQDRSSTLRLELLLMALREIFLLVEEEPRVRGQLDERIGAALERMSADLRSRHTVATLAATAGLSPSRFAHLFQAEVGISPVRAIRRMRLREATVQLRYTDRTVEAIAEDAGFTSPSHLSREFRREYGVSPVAYRARASGRRSG
jgi:AraC family transcriptional regulator of arabinose operon